MERCKILLTRSMAAGDIEYLRNGLSVIVGNCFDIVQPSAYDEQEICEAVEDADILLGPYVTEKVLASAKKTRLIQVPWTGMDTFNFSAMKGCNIPVCNSHSNADSVAELGVALLLDLLKKVSYHDRKMRSGNWNRDQRPLNLKSKMLKESSVCILGCGNIGYRIAKILDAFGATIIGVDDKQEADEVIQEVYGREQMMDVVGTDIVVCALPLTDDTRGLFNELSMAYFKDSAYIVNMSRAEIFTEDGVYKALSGGKIAGFAADIWWSAPKRGESESYPSNKYDFQMFDNIILSPHRGGFVDGCFPHLDDAIANISRLIKGLDLMNIVDVEKQY